jgi:hypothetical protein
MPVDLATKVLDDKKIPIEGAVVQISVDKPEVAVATSTGQLHCLSAGDITVTLKHGELSSEFGVQCRPIAEIATPETLRVVWGTPVAFAPELKDAKGNKVEGVELSVESDATSIVSYREGQLYGSGLGKATLTLKAGSIEKKMPVVVVRQVVADSIALRDGEGMVWSMPQGNFEIDIKVQAGDMGGSGVTVKWMWLSTQNDPALCPEAQESQQISLKCKLTGAASLIVTNPTTFGNGPQVVGPISVVQIPE